MYVRQEINSSFRDFIIETGLSLYSCNLYFILLKGNILLWMILCWKIYSLTTYCFLTFCGNSNKYFVRVLRLCVNLVARLTMSIPPWLLLLELFIMEVSQNFVFNCDVKYYINICPKII